MSQRNQQTHAMLRKPATTRPKEFQTIWFFAILATQAGLDTFNQQPFPGCHSVALARVLLFVDSLRGSSDKIGTIQRRLAWPLRKDDTHYHLSLNYLHCWLVCRSLSRFLLCFWFLLWFVLLGVLFVGCVSRFLCGDGTWRLIGLCIGPSPVHFWGPSISRRPFICVN